MSYSVLIYHFANVLNMASWLVTDILWVRALAVCGNAITIFYYAQHVDLYHVNIPWHALYIGINLIQIGMLVSQRRPIKFSARELRLFKVAFVGLSPFEFKRLLRLVHWRELNEGCVLARKGEMLKDVMVIVSGEAQVTVDSEIVSELVPGNFVGEISFIHGGPATADVVTVKSTLVAAWDKLELQSFLRRNPTISNAWQIVMGHDLVNKVSFHTNAHTSTTEREKTILDL